MFLLLSRCFATVAFLAAVAFAVLAVALAATGIGIPAAFIVGFAAFLLFAGGRVMWNGGFRG